MTPGRFKTEKNCALQADACTNCAKPADMKYKCNHTTTPDGKASGKCERCEGAITAECKSATDCLKDCETPQPPPQPDAKTFTCDNTTFVCKESNATGALPESACDDACQNSNPEGLKGTVWRGVSKW